MSLYACMLLLCWKQSGGREAKLIALFTFRDTSFSSNGPIRCESIWDHFFCMRRSFLFCLTHANTHAHLSLLPLSSNDTFPKFGSLFFFFHAAFERLRCLPVEDERYGRYHHHTHTEDNHDYVLRVDACKQHTQLEGFFFSSTFPYFHISIFMVQGYQVKHKHTRTSFCRGLSRSLPVYSGTSSGKTPPLQNRAGDLSMMVVWFLDVSKTTRVSYWKQTEAKHRCVCGFWLSNSGRIASVFHVVISVTWELG